MTSVEYPAYPLEPGQYQVGNFVFGDKTLFPVEDFAPGGYDINAQDFQVVNNDEMRFGSDSLKPLPIQIQMHAIKNRMLPNVAALSAPPPGMTFDYDRKVGVLAREWRADEVRAVWGALKYIRYCREDGTTVRIYGRPGKLAVSKPTRSKIANDIVAEFRRSDTVCYGDFEWYLHCRPLEITTVLRADDFGAGDAPSWLRIGIVGPATHPIIQIGNIIVDLDYDVEAGEVVEISSYPWSRRVISAEFGYNLAARLNSPFLDQLKFPPNSAIQVSWTATNLNSEIESVDFTELVNGPLSSTDWDVTGGLAIDTGKLVATSTGHARYKAAHTVTDYQLVGFTVAAPAGAGLGVNRIKGRVNADGTEYTYCDISLSSCWFGFHRDGVDTQISPTYSIAHTINKVCWLFGWLSPPSIPDVDWKYEVEFGTGANVRSYALRINDKAVVTFTESDSAYSTFGPGNRYTGLAITKAGSSIGGPLSEFHMRDNPPPELASQLDVSQMFVLWRDAWNVI